MHHVILGLGESGEAAARLLRREGAAVTVLDEGDSAALRVRASRLRRDGVRVRLGARAVWPPEADLCVVSPGVPRTSALRVAARAAGVRVVSELELGGSRISARTLAVTGSNGKSTLVKWLTESIEAAGCTAVAAGNYGMPVSRVALERNRPDWLVLEVSSFQLETVSAFRPDIGVLLNVLPNHLDRHGSLAAYRAAKSRLFGRMGPDRTAVVPAELRGGIARCAGSKARWVTFGTGKTCDYRWERGRVYRGRECVMDVAGTWFDNEVLGPAAAAAAAAFSAAELPVAGLEEAAHRFRPLPHRMEPVAERNGIAFVDDSKATSLAALVAGLRQTAGPVRLIAGGQAKGDSPESVKEMLANRCRKVYLIGKDAGSLAVAWSDSVRCEPCGTLERAVEQAASDAQRGETVLLSPGCASFDQFDGFEQRGAAFKKYVRAWVGSVSQPCRPDSDAEHICRKGRG